MHIRLVQKGVIRHPGHDYLHHSVVKAIDLSYMGYVEYEGFARQRSIETMYETAGRYRLSAIPQIKDPRVLFRIPFTSQGMLRLYHRFNDSQLKDYVELLVKLRKGERLTTGNSGFKEISKDNWRAESKIEQPDFWWDITNHAVWSFDASFMKHRLCNHIVSSHYFPQDDDGLF